MILFQNFYLNKQREKEILFCLERNLENKHIEQIVFFVYKEDEYSKDYLSLYIHDKITVVEIDAERPSFSQLFEYIKQFCIDAFEVPIVVLANLDIFFDETIGEINKVSDWHIKTFAITRWEFNGHKQSRYIGWDYSQDVWIWKYPMNTKGMDLDFLLGKPGCDNRLAYEFSKNYEVINPCKTIRCHHYHISNFRNYTPGNPNETVPEPYLRVEPSEL